MFNFLGNHPLWESVVRGAYTEGTALARPRMPAWPPCVRLCLGCCSLHWGFGSL